MDRDLLFEKFLDNVELYFDCRTQLKAKIRKTPSDALVDMTYEGLYWQEYQTLEAIRVLARRALDEYVASAV